VGTREGCDQRQQAIHEHRSTGRIVHHASDQPVEQGSIEDCWRTVRAFLVEAHFIKRLLRTCLERQDAPKEFSTEATQHVLKVLIVDENIDAAQTLAMLLREANGYNVAVCHDGRSALRLAETDAPDAVILDIGLPDIDGYELARRLWKLKLLADTKLIALTGYGQQQDVALAMQAGFNHHLAKPANPQTLVDLLCNAVG
jgi:CheY-like chemotaxis protein